MKKLAKTIGLVTFYITLPVLALILNSSQRTRVIVVHAGKVLVLRGWLGNNKWILPGGGLHRGEEPIVGALRELYEETGIALAPGQLKSHDSVMVHEHAIVRYRAHVYSVELDKIPRIALQAQEIAEAAWIDPVKHWPSMGAATQQVLQRWNPEL